MKQRTRRYRALATVFAVAIPALALTSCTRFGATLTRPSEPLVLTGSSLPKLTGTDPMHIVGFSWDGSAWHQVPVQVDERDLVSPGQIYHWPTARYPNLSGTTTPYTMLVYTPPSTPSPGYTSDTTYTPPDSNPTFDGNDELSLLANDTGKQVSGATPSPPGVDATTREAVKVTDPLVPSQVGYTYLFHSATGTGGSAGTDGVNYTFSLDSGAYTTTYKMGVGSLSPNNTWGFNPEHSTVVTPAYRVSMGDRWLNNGLAVTAGTSTATNILDRAHYFVVGGGCSRSEDTFDGGANNPGEGAFIANISGPVRAIRSYIGANSYLYTVNTEIFYPERQDSVIELRGHAGLPGYGSADDYATGASGLTYSDPKNRAIAIDGTPDAVTPIGYATGAAAPDAWQMVTGRQGSVVTVRTLDTSITGLNVTTVYQDRNPASPAQCTGDAAAWGQNGSNVTSPVFSVPVTDPTLTAKPATFVTHRLRYFRPPNLSAVDAATINSQAIMPVQTNVSG